VNRDDVRAQLYQLLADAAGKTPDDVAAAPSLRELGLDSLMLYELLDKIETTLAVRLDEDPPLRLSVAELVARVEALWAARHA